MFSPAMPYFDILLSRLAATDSELAWTLGRHVHWGYWADPQRADRSAAGYAQAAEAMTLRIAQAAQIAQAATVLDVGCGFGGTLSCLLERQPSLRGVGINIDARQLRRAAGLCAQLGPDRVAFAQGDGCRLPIADASVDAVLAVECIFHFASRRRFLLEAKRVLRPGGYVAISDFVPFGPTIPALALLVPFFERAVVQVYGRGNMGCTSLFYRLLARQVGLRVVCDEDITDNTLPTYDALARLSGHLGEHGPAFARASAWMGRLAKSGLLRYRILAFQRPNS